MTDVSCLSSNFFFQIATPRTVFFRFLPNLARVFYVPIRTKLYNRFSNFFKKFGELFKFQIALSLMQQQQRNSAGRRPPSSCLISELFDSILADTSMHRQTTG